MLGIFKHFILLRNGRNDNQTIQFIWYRTLSMRLVFVSNWCSTFASDLYVGNSIADFTERLRKYRIHTRSFQKCNSTLISIRCMFIQAKLKQTVFNSFSLLIRLLTLDYHILLCFIESIIKVRSILYHHFCHQCVIFSKLLEFLSDWVTEQKWLSKQTIIRIWDVNG